MLCNPNMFENGLPFGYGDGVEDDMRLSVGPEIGCGPEIGDTIRTAVISGSRKLQESGMQGDVLRHGVLDSVGMKPGNSGHSCSGIEDIRGFDVTKRAPRSINGMPIWNEETCTIGNLTGDQYGIRGAKKLNRQPAYHSVSPNGNGAWDRFSSGGVTAPNTSARRNSSFVLRNGVGFERRVDRYAKGSSVGEMLYSRMLNPEITAGRRRDGLDSCFDSRFIENMKPKQKPPRELPMRCPPPSPSPYYPTLQQQMPRPQIRHQRRPATVGDVFDSSYPYMWLD